MKDIKGMKEMKKSLQVHREIDWRHPLTWLPGQRSPSFPSRPSLPS
jgi:hypothetical protein